MEICDFLKSWKRMCDSMTEMNGCEDCPIVRNTYGARCCDMTCEMRDVEAIVREVEKWAAEHPEPVYPTVYEWLVSIGLLGSDMWTMSDLYKPIPADLAEKLGIEPKEE